MNEVLSLTLHGVKSPTDLEVMALMTGDELDDLARANEASPIMDHVPATASRRQVRGVLSILDQLDRNLNREDRA